MHVGISTASLYNRCMLEDAPELFFGWGVSDAEYFLNSFCEYRPAFIDLLKQRTERYGLTVHNVHPMSSMFESQLFSLHPRQREDAFRIFRSVLEAAKALSAKHYVMHGAAHMSGAAKNLETERVAKTLDELCTMAADYGVTIALENVSWCFYHRPETALAFLDAMQTDLLHFTLDIKQAIRSGVDPCSIIEAVGDRIDVLHVCDCDRSGERPRYCLPPQGGYDIKGVVEALLKKGFCGTVMLEAYSDMYTELSELNDSYKILKQLLK